MSGRPTKIAQEAKKMREDAGKQLAVANAILKQEALKKQKKKQEKTQEIVIKQKKTVQKK